MVEDTQYVLWQASFLHRAQQVYHSNGYLKKLHEAELVEAFPKIPSGKSYVVNYMSLKGQDVRASRPCSTFAVEHGLEAVLLGHISGDGVRVYAKMKDF